MNPNPASGLDLYLVGGAVRDELLGLPVHERDWVVVGASAETMRARGFEPVDADFPVFLHPQTREEYALARRETKRAAGHKGFSVYAGPDVTLKEDLSRRDLRVNAIARTTTGTLVDPFDGRVDIEARTLRHVTAAFSEDPLRVLRAARFLARLAPLGFRIDPGTMTLMRRMSASGELETLAPERVWRETDKALRAAAPGRYFEALAACRALGRLFPELGTSSTDAGAGAVSRCPGGDPPTTFAAFAVGAMDPTVVDRGAAFEELSERLRVPRPCREVGLLAIRLADHARGSTRNASAVASLLETTDAFRRPQRFADALAACRAALTGDAATTRLTELERAHRAATAVEAGPLAAAGYSGASLGAELARRRRVAVLESIAG